MSTTSTIRPSTADRDDALRELISGTAAAVGESPQQAAVQFSATGRGTGSVTTRISTRDHEYLIDEPASLGGDDLAANPVEHALGALLACQVVTYRVWAAHLGIKVDDIEIHAVGDLDVRGFYGLDDAVRPGYSQIQTEVHLTGPETAERYAELQRSVDAHCPVLDLFTNPTPVHATLRTTRTD